MSSWSARARRGTTNSANRRQTDTSLVVMPRARAMAVPRASRRNRNGRVSWPTAFVAIAALATSAYADPDPLPALLARTDMIAKQVSKQRGLPLKRKPLYGLQTFMTNLCPACGATLDFLPWSSDESPSEEVCPCCGIHFGYDDAAGGDPAKRPLIYRQWRADWVALGSRWLSTTRPAPRGWSATMQLRDSELH